MDLRTGIRVGITAVVMALMVACGVDASTPPDGARSHTEPPPSIAAVADALSEAGIEYNPCGRMCTQNFLTHRNPGGCRGRAGARGIS